MREVEWGGGAAPATAGRAGRPARHGAHPRAGGAVQQWALCGHTFAVVDLAVAGAAMVADEIPVAAIPRGAVLASLTLRREEPRQNRRAR